MTASQPVLKQYHWAQSVIARFMARRTVVSAAFWALVFGALVASKAAGYTVAAPTATARAQLAASFSNNIGLTAMLGAPNHINMLTGYVTWNTLSSMVLIGAIWAFLTATKTFRGNEGAGRWELLLTGQTTARRAALNALAGLGVSLVVLYVIAALGFTLTGHLHAVNFSTGAALFFALAGVAAAAEFVAIGALMSQLMPTRGRAAMASAVVFGACFLVRATGDISSAHWLVNISPLGWIEQLQPLYSPQPLWLLPIAGLILLCSILTVWLSGQRDLGDSILPDRDTAKPRYRLLASPLLAAVRFTRAGALSWLAAAAFISLFFGVLTKSASEAFASSPVVAHALSQLAHNTQSNLVTIASKTYLGVVFFFLMLILMAYVASALGAMREEEADSYLDNFLVRKVSRVQWLAGRLSLIVMMIIMVGLVGSLAAWIGEASQGSGVGFSTLLPAGINVMPPALFALGASMFALGVVPRLTSLMAYGILAWSFLVQIVGSGLKLNHWLLDTSVFNHVAFAPAADPKWTQAIVLVVLGIVLAVIGIWQFNRRDLQSE